MRWRAGEGAVRNCRGEGAEAFDVGTSSVTAAAPSLSLSPSSICPETGIDSVEEKEEEGEARALREMEEMNPARRRTERTPRCVRE